ncbi:MAG: hypothetical protein GX275_11120 [Clostridiales bacterium]|nr:hypothetical protein [Clostridiales bacterium]
MRIESMYVDLKYKFYLIYILNVTDIIFTLILLSTGEFSEVNELMKNIVQNKALAILIKGIMVLLLTLYIVRRLKNANEFQLNISRYIVTSVLFLYMIINISHIYWITFTFS